MQAVTTIGLDIAKSVFQIHGVGAAGNVIVRRQLKRRVMWRLGGEQHVMQSRPIRRSGQPTSASASRMRAFGRDLIRGGHYGQRPCVPR
jgi:hypothetical protein